MPAPVSSSKKTKPKPKSKGQERSRLQALAALPSQDVSAQPGNQQEAAGLSEVSQTQPDLPKEAPVPAVSAAAEGQQEPPSPGTVGTPSLADNDTAWGASAEQLRLRSSLQASSRTAQGLPSSTRPKAEQQAGEGAASNALPSKGSPTRSGQGLSSHSPPSRPVTGTSDSFLEGRGLKASTPAALQKGGLLCRAQVLQIGTRLSCEASLALFSSKGSQLLQFASYRRQSVHCRSSNIRGSAKGSSTDFRKP